VIITKETLINYLKKEIEDAGIEPERAKQVLDNALDYWTGMLEDACGYMQEWAEEIINTVEGDFYDTSKGSI
jgi:hypothetical protein